jgi:hypothetical protein
MEITQVAELQIRLYILKNKMLNLSEKPAINPGKDSNKIGNTTQKK